MPDENHQPDPQRTNGPGDAHASHEVPEPGEKKEEASRRLPLPKPLRHAIEQVAGAIGKEFMISDRKQAERAGRAFARALYPARRPGRPQHSDVTRALLLEAEGKSRKEIYRVLVKKTHEKQHALREAMRHRKMRDKRRAVRDKSRPPIVMPINSDGI